MRSAHVPSTARLKVGGILLAVLLAGVVGEQTGLWRVLDHWARDRALSAAAAPGSPEVVVVAIDDASVQALGPWPWSRTALAGLTDRLAAAGARTLVLSEPLAGRENQLALDELQRLAAVVATDPNLARHPDLPTELLHAQGLLQTDAELARSMKAHGRVLLAVASPVTGEVRSPIEAAAWGLGQTDLQPDPDGVLRRHALQDPGGAAPSLAWLAARAQGDPAGRPDGVAMGASGPAGAPELRGHRIPLDAALRVEPILPRPGAGGAFLTLSAHSLLNPARTAPRLEGALVWIGRTDAAAGTVARSPGGAPLTRVEALAQLSASLLAGELLQQPPWRRYAPWALLAGVALYLAWARARLSSATALAVAAGIAVALWLGSHLLVRPLQVWVPVAMPAAVLLAGVLVMLALRRRAEALALPSYASTELHESRYGSVTRPLSTLVEAPPVPEAPELSLARPAEREAAVGIDVMLSRWMASSAFDRAPRSDPQTLPMDYGPDAAGARSGAAVSPGNRPLRLGSFLLLRELGRGTMGRVYLARDTRSGQQVALKTLALAPGFEGYALREARERFQREAQAAQRLDHPDIVVVIEAGEEGGLAYIAMELLAGNDLSEHIHPGALLPVAQVVDIGVRVAGALAHAHRQGVIHRDIKPANVMVDLPSDQVKVTDFGVARLHDASRTRTGLVLGSPAYMAPEQLVGRPVDGRSDLYSLGVLLYQLLTGELPVGGTSMGELMQAVAHQPAPDLRECRPELPEALANVVSILLEKRPELRYREGQAVADDLRLVAAMLHRATRAPIDFQPTERLVGPEAARDPVSYTAAFTATVSELSAAFMATSVQEVAAPRPLPDADDAGMTGTRSQSGAQ